MKRRQDVQLDYTEITEDNVDKYIDVIEKYMPTIMLPFKLFKFIQNVNWESTVVLKENTTRFFELYEVAENKFPNEKQNVEDFAIFATRLDVFCDKLEQSFPNLIRKEKRTDFYFNNTQKSLNAEYHVLLNCDILRNDEKMYFQFCAALNNYLTEISGNLSVYIVNNEFLTIKVIYNSNIYENGVDVTDKMMASFDNFVNTFTLNDISASENVYKEAVIQMEKLFIFIGKNYFSDTTIRNDPNSTNPNLYSFYFSFSLNKQYNLILGEIARHMYNKLRKHLNKYSIRLEFIQYDFNIYEMLPM